MIDSIFVAVGGFFGAMSRYGISLWASRRPSSFLPVGTLIVNLVGSFLLGILAGSHVGGAVSMLLGTGYMGAFTTFSTFKLESIQLGRKREWKVLIIYLLVSYIAGIMLASFGYWIGHMIQG
ncbi:fluoride efflux transporter CrcB [Ferviditalea candida]|uniref:Fluoride-specific ion channel FluC n=1 Tax=Ferviditalea candida TaxID=3108399 RepID=A0ABU5ZFZ7_9BACL|nr:fluoride efflux transporter CrcB [Paenibacillaceae bacterium T2]